MNGADTPALLERLATGPGAALLAALPRYAEDQVLPLVARLRGEGHDPDLVAAALTQSRLREAARPRFGDLADRLLLTQDGLEQATRPVVARRRARRFLAAGVSLVWDLGCGLGLDAMALAEAGLQVTAVERDPAVAVAARTNLAPWPGVEVQVGDAEQARPAPGDGVFLDPARRTPGVADARGRTRRSLRLEDLSPSWAFVQQVAASVRAAGAKLSPVFPRSAVPPGVEAEWVSVDGGVVECTLWWGAAAPEPGRRAVVGRPGPQGEVAWTVVGPPGCGAADPLAPGDPVRGWLAEPDRAVVAAGRADALTALTGGQELDDGVGYVTADRVVPLPWVSWYAVQEVLPLHARAVRGWLRERGVEQVTIKKRGVPTDPEAFRRELRLAAGRRGRRGSGGASDGDHAGQHAGAATLVLTRLAGTGAVLVVEPVSDPRSAAGR